MGKAGRERQNEVEGKERTREGKGMEPYAKAVFSLLSERKRNCLPFLMQVPFDNILRPPVHRHWPLVDGMTSMSSPQEQL